MLYTRRDLGKIALAALPAGMLLAKPNSNFGGVAIGIIISPVIFKDMPLSADQILKNLVELGISNVEMQDVRVEAYAGAPGSPRIQGRATPEQQAARRKVAQELQVWRAASPGGHIDKYRALRKMYDGAGVKMYAFRVSTLNKDTSDDELAYYFDTAQALGANQITTELPRDAALSQRFGDYAAKRKIMMGYHNHTQVKFDSWDTALAQSKYNGINFDVGHYVAAVSESPVPFIEKYHDRITCLHLKDRKFGTKGGQNVPWGEGDTPLKEVLTLMKRNNYKFPAGIELEYKIPENSSTMAEIAKCLQFCRNALA